MGGENRTVWNITTNSAGVVVNMLSGLLVMPYLIRTLGSSTYGLWILIGTLSGYFGVLDLGVTAALGRLIAAHRARGEFEQVNAVMSTACALLLIVSLVVCLATCVVLVVFPLLFAVPADRSLDVRYSLILVGVTLALTFPTSIFMGFLWGYERFDLQNAVDIPTLVVRTVLSMTAVSAAVPLTSLGAISFTVVALSSVARMAVCFRLEPDLQISWRHFRRSKVREIFAIGGWMSVISWSRTLIPQIAPTLVGVRLGNAAVTTFTVARQLVVYANIFANSATQVMAPSAIAAHATRSVTMQTQLFIEGGKFAYALTLFFCGGLFCLGLPFIHWWQHGSQDASYGPLLVLTLGESLPMSQWLTYSVLLGANRQRMLAVLAVIEGVICLPLILAFLHRSGITGVCIGVALSGFVVRGVVQWIYGCQLLKVSLGAYSRRVFAPVTVAAVLPIAALYVATLAVAPGSFRAIVMLGAAYTIVYAVTLGWMLLGYTRLKTLVMSASLQPERSRSQG
jgi:O-antigen/teichoic acid export membrane protein